MACQVDVLITALSLDVVHTNPSDLAPFAIIVTMYAKRICMGNWSGNVNIYHKYVTTIIIIAQP